MRPTCDHVVGTCGSHLVRASQLTGVLAGFTRALAFFRTTKLAVPALGQLTAHAHCSDCGARLDDESAADAIRAATSKAFEDDFKHGLGRESYIDWLLMPLPAAEPAVETPVPHV